MRNTAASVRGGRTRKPTLSIPPSFACWNAGASAIRRPLVSIRCFCPTEEFAIHRLVSELTVILRRIDAGDPHAANQLLPLVYEELRKLAAQKMARESPGQT